MEAVGPSSYRRRLGRFGEDLAARFLESRGAEITGRNLRVGRDELDVLVRWPDRTRSIVEVKTRTGGPPIEAFRRSKADKVKRAGSLLSISRIDLIAVNVTVDGVEIHWIPRIA